MIKGLWYPKESSARQGAELSMNADHFLVTKDDGVVIRGNIAELKVSSRVGNITCRVVLPDQSLFETEDNNSIDTLLHECGKGSGFNRFLHHMETRWRWIVGAICIAVLLGYLTLYLGMPVASKKIAYALPKSILELVSEQTIALLDKGFLDETKLPIKEQQRIRTHFINRLEARIDSEFDFQLQFRDIEGMANAFALPSGIIIVTDELVGLVDSQEQLDAVLYHEMGHVVLRHGMQRVLHSSFIAMAVILMTGDLSSVENLAVALPVFLLENQYSREDEHKADHYAFKSMIKMGVDPVHFAEVIEKLNVYYRMGDDSKTQNDDAVSEKKSDKVIDYLSSHPDADDRIQRAREYSKLFNNSH